MQPFDSLTQRGQQRRMLHMAYQVMKNYNLEVRQITFLTMATNMLYKVVTTSGEKLVLRFYSDKDSTMAENHTELFWLNALSRDTDLNVVQPVLRKDGEMINITNMPGLPANKRCALFRWIPGNVLEEQITSVNYHQLGEFMARLHTHSESLCLPPEIHPKRWDRVFYYPGEKAIYRLPQYRTLFSAERVALMDEAVQRCDAFLPTLYNNGKPPILIHGDLHPGNVHVHNGQLYVLDFEDNLLGYPIQDIAITFYYQRSRPDYPKLVSAFRRGYTSQRPWPVRSEADLYLLMAARNANFINYVAEIDPKAENFLAGMFTRLKEFLKDKKTPR
jgi:Ser/Thr protein kinase RdoA (MazF antagonist)